MKLVDKRINQENQFRERVCYEAPEVIYEALITTRAGSPAPFSIEDPSGVDPIDLFGND